MLKRSADTELMQAIRTVHAGGVFLYPSAARLLVDDRASDDGESAGLDLLTEREREVLKLTVEGLYEPRDRNSANHQCQDRRHVSIENHGETKLTPPLRVGTVRSEEGPTSSFLIRSASPYRIRHLRNNLW